MDTLVRIIMYYNVPNNVDSLLKKRHPDAGENRVRQGCRTRFSAQWTAAGIAKCSNEGLLQNKILKNQAKEKVSENRQNGGSR